MKAFNELFPIWHENTNLTLLIYYQVTVPFLEVKSVFFIEMQPDF